MNKKKRHNGRWLELFRDRCLMAEFDISSFKPSGYTTAALVLYDYYFIFILAPSRSVFRQFRDTG